MNNKNYVLTIVFFLLLCTSSLFAEEIKYNFIRGAVYSYNYSIQDSSTVNIPIIGTKSVSDNYSTDFVIKSVGFRDNAFILDIGNEYSTYRRYVAPNGDLIGSPAEDRDSFPFFIKFPSGEWNVGNTKKVSIEVDSFGKKIPVTWNMTLNKIDKDRSLAEITFDTIFKISDDRLYSKSLTMKGQIIFNLSEGVIHQAVWKTNYSAKQICKEIAITRNLWSFSKETVYKLRMVGIEK